MSGLSEINVAFMAHRQNCSKCGDYASGALCKQGSEILQWFHKVLVAEVIEETKQLTKKASQ
jgi:hypothetical protein